MNLAQALHVAVRRFCDAELRPGSALRAELDRIDVANLEDIELSRELVVKIASNVVNSREKSDSALVLEYVRNLTDHELYKLNPLPYRRRLDRSVAKTLLRRLRRFEKRVENIETFQEGPFEEGVLSQAYDFLAERGVTRVWELCEDESGCEIELSLFEPYFNGIESFWTSADFDWLVRVSHHDSITVGGWLLGEIQTVWPEWDHRLWRAS